MSREDVVIAGYARTPFGRFGGALRTLPLPPLGAIAYRGALEHAGVDPTEVDQVVVGVNFPGSERSVARQVSLRTGVPDDRNAFTVDRACCSSLTAITLASRGLRLEEYGVAIAGGVDNLSRVPYFLETARFGSRIGHITLSDQLVVTCPHTGVPRAVQAGREAVQYGVDREQQDAWALRSYERALEAAERGAFEDEVVIVDVEDPQGMAVHLDRDEELRPDTSAAKLSQLATVYGSPTVTAGNAPGMSSGASAIVLMSHREAGQRGVQPLGTIEGWTTLSGHPQHIASVPGRAARQALDRAGLDLDDIDLFEINEAFAAVPLVATLVLAGGDVEEAEKLRARTNVNGGAVALGHPTGATAARLVMTIVSELGRRGGGTGLVSICGGIGEAEAVVVRVAER